MLLVRQRSKGKQERGTSGPGRKRSDVTSVTCRDDQGRFSSCKKAGGMKGKDSESKKH